MANTIDVGILITAADKASGVFKQVARAGERAGKAIAKSFDKAGKAIAGIGNATRSVGASLSKLSLPVAGLGVVATKFAADFETAMTNVATLIKGDASPAIEKLSKGILELSQVVPRSPEELGASAYAIFSAGITDVNDALKVLESSAKLGVAGLGSQEEAVNLVTVAMNAFGISADEVDRVSEVLFKTVKNGITDISRLSVGFGDMAGNAVAAGISLEDSQAATAALSAGTGKTAESQSKLKVLFQELTLYGGKLDKSLQSNGSSLAELNLAISQKGLGGGMEAIRKSIGASETEFKNFFGSAEAGTAVFSLLTNASDAYKESLADMQGPLGDLDAAFAKQVKTFNAQKKILQNQISVAFIEIGSTILPILIPIFQKVGQAVKSATTWFKGLSGENQKLIVIFGAIVAAVGPVLVVIGTVIAALGGMIATVGAAVGAFTAFVASASFAPILAGVAAVVAAVAGIGVAIASNFGGIRDRLTEFGAAMITAFAPALDQVKEIFSALRDAFSDVWTAISEEIGPALEPIFAQLFGSLTGAGEGFAETFAEILGRVAEYIREITPTVVNAISTVAAFLEENGPVIAATIEGIVRTIITAISAAVTLVKMNLELISAAISLQIAIITETVNLASEWYSIIKNVVSRISSAVSSAWENARMSTEAGVASILEVVETAREWVDAIGAIMTEFYAQIAGAVSGAYNYFKDRIDAMLAHVVEVKDKFYNAGKGMIEAFVSGLKELANKPAEFVKDNILAKIEELLPGSDAKTGPLSHLTASGKALAETFARGIGIGAKAPVKAVADMGSEIANETAAINQGVSDSVSRVMGAFSGMHSGGMINIGSDIDDATQSRLQQIEESYARELALAERHGKDLTNVHAKYNQMLADEHSILMEETAIAETERTERIKAALASLQEIRRADMENINKGLQMQGGFFGDLSGAMSEFYAQAGEQAQSYFEVAKGAAIAEAVINAYLAMSKALATIPPPLSYAVAAVSFAKAITAVSAIASQKPSAMALGGIVRSPTQALIGEAGPEAIIPLDKMPMMGARANVNNTSVNINGGVFTMEPRQARQFARQITRYIQAEEAR